MTPPFALCLAPIEAIGLAALERVRPLRTPIHSKMRRRLVNLTLAAQSAATMLALYPLVILPLAQRNAQSRPRGVRRNDRAGCTRMMAGVLALDATLWLWHVLNHRVGTLWRFHAVHHIDGDLDLSTAVRFHAGELALSVLWRAAQVALFRIDLRTLLSWELAVLLSIQFHHSNVRLPKALDRILRVIVATPRLHGIHHSRRTEELDSNFANLFTFWDRLFGTYRRPDRDQIEIGLAGFRPEERVSLLEAMFIPFRDDARLLGPATK